ncbi:MAG: hypothetical protein NC191_00630 [Muribaculaceae bacterium]|nr:hypothetical protein [Muribaculaceae bacterium]
MKKLVSIFMFLIMLIFSSAAAFAAGNNLHTITLEKNNLGYNIILGSDKVAKVTKKTLSENELILTLYGVSSSESVNAIYKGINNINSLIIENTSPNKLKVYIKADDIKNSTIMIEPIIGETTIVAESLPLDKVLWVVFVLALFAVIFKVSKDISEDEDKILIKKDIKDREIELYRRYKSGGFVGAELSAGSDLRMRKMIKKIDRRIDERLASSVR